MGLHLPLTQVFQAGLLPERLKIAIDKKLIRNSSVTKNSIRTIFTYNRYVCLNVHTWNCHRYIERCRYKENILKNLL